MTSQLILSQKKGKRVQKVVLDLTDGKNTSSDIGAIMFDMRKSGDKDYSITADLKFSDIGFHFDTDTKDLDTISEVLGDIASKFMGLSASVRILKSRDTEKENGKKKSTS